VLVELKYTHTLPRLIMEMFRRNGMRATTFSKYTLCLENCMERLPSLAG
jgi:hypothetical protein